MVQRAPVGRDVHAANLALIEIFTGAMLLDERATLVLAQPLPGPLADVPVVAGGDEGLEGEYVRKPLSSTAR